MIYINFSLKVTKRAKKSPFALSISRGEEVRKVEMAGKAGIVGGLVAVPINIGIIVAVLSHYICGMSDMWCVSIGAAIAVPGAVIAHILLMRYWRKQDGEKR